MGVIYKKWVGKRGLEMVGGVGKPKLGSPCY